jgi:hypothetical protein
MLSKVHQRERVTAKSPHGKLNYILVGHHELVTTGGVGGAPEQILPGIGEGVGGGGDDWMGLRGT